MMQVSRPFRVQQQSLGAAVPEAQTNEHQAAASLTPLPCITRAGIQAYGGVLPRKQ